MDAYAPDADVIQLLSALLAHDFPGVEVLRDQLRGLTVRPGCSCGCGSLDLQPRTAAAKSPASSPVPVEGAVFDDLGSTVGGLLLFVADGMLSSLEVYSYDSPLAMPSAAKVRWFAQPR